MDPFLEPDELQAIIAIKPDAKFNIADNRNLGGEKTIQWWDGNPTNITQEQIDAKLKELKEAYDKLEYARNRAYTYPSIEEQLDDIYNNGLDSWKTKIKAVKDKYPKPS
tara:strand:+ start:274 stop:600 length:327 start_codon:yes stop_codon:yes gene_type:complete